MKYLVTSDIHLGHLKTPTKHIINSFKTQILNNKNTDLDVIFIAGDLFDRLLDLNSKEVHYIIDFFHSLLDYCSNNNILLRILEGTPSHDWQQSELLIKLNDIRTKKCNLKYFKILDIEYISEFNKYVLYIPDEWCDNHDKLEEQINEKLHNNFISKVDIAILHGQFKYQVSNKPYHGFYFKEEYFLSIVTGYIHVGHYHEFNPLDRIIPNGSLDRLAHGEESPKGYIIVDNDRYTFLENILAYIYKTINITSTTTIERLDKYINSYPKGSYIRLLLSKDHPFNITFHELKLRYLDYNLKKISKENISKDSSITYILSDTEIEFNSNYLLSSNIYSTLLETISSKYTLNSIENSKLLNYISMFKEINDESVVSE